MKTTIEKSCLTEIPHERGKLAFQHQIFRGYIRNIAEQIDKSKLKRIGSAETASLIYDAWVNPEEKDSSKIIKILNQKWFWEFTGNLYLPKSNGPAGVSSGEKINNGVILDLDPQNLKFNEYSRLIMDKDSLIKRLKSNDPLVKFVPFGYKTGEQTWQELEKNRYIQERYGKEGAQKIAEIASKYPYNPHIYSFDYPVSEEKIRVSALGRLWYLYDRLSVSSISQSNSEFGHAFGCAGDKKI